MNDDYFLKNVYVLYKTSLLNDVLYIIKGNMVEIEEDVFKFVDVKGTYPPSNIDKTFLDICNFREVSYHISSNEDEIKMDYKMLLNKDINKLRRELETLEDLQFNLNELEL